MKFLTKKLSLTKIDRLLSELKTFLVEDQNLVEYLYKQILRD